MATKEILLYKLSEIATTAAAAVNLTDAKNATKIVIGPYDMAGFGLASIGGMCVDYSGNIYVTDVSKHVIFKVTESGQIKLVAGCANASGNNSALQNVAAADARFNAPRGIACDKTGNIYVADTGNNQIRIIKDGKVSVYAGNGACGAGLVDASSNPLQSKFSSPYDVAIDNAGNLIVCDYGNNAIRKIWGGQVLTIAGGVAGDHENVRASKITGVNAIFSGPKSVAVDVAGMIYVADTTNKKIKKISQDGWVYLHSGSGTAGHSLGTDGKTAATSKQYTCTYEAPISIRCDRNGYVYLLDLDGRANYSRLVKLNPLGVPANIVDFHASTIYNGIKGLAVSPAMKVFVGVQN